MTKLTITNKINVKQCSSLHSKWQWEFKAKEAVQLSPTGGGGRFNKPDYQHISQLLCDFSCVKSTKKINILILTLRSAILIRYKSRCHVCKRWFSHAVRGRSDSLVWFYCCSCLFYGCELFQSSKRIERIESKALRSESSFFSPPLSLREPVNPTSLPLFPYERRSQQYVYYIVIIPCVFKSILQDEICLIWQQTHTLKRKVAVRAGMSVCECVSEACCVKLCECSSRKALYRSQSI